MKKKTVEEHLDDFIKEYSNLFKSLSENIMCPVCKEIVEPPFYNLGSKYNSFEGCKDCYEKTKENS